MGQPANGITNEEGNLTISMKEKISYGFGDLASNFLFGFVGMFLVFYYTDVAMMDAGIIGTIILLSRIFDGITDIIMGFVVDRTKSKHGKARPWLLWMAIPFAVSAILLFTIPEGPVISIVYVIVTYNLVNIIYTAVNIPYGVLNSLITQDQNGRADLNIIRMINAMVGVIIVSVITIPMVNAFGGDKYAWLLTIGIMSIIGSVLLLVTFKNTKERVKPSSKAAEGKNVPFVQSLSALFKNKYWIMIAFFGFFTFLGQGLGNGVTIYFAKNILNNSELVGIIVLTSILPVLIGLFFMAPFIKRYGKRNVSLFGLVIFLIGCLVMAINPGSLAFILIGNIIKGLGAAPMTGSVFAMLADTIEYGEWKTRIRNEGMLYSAAGFGAKSGMGFGAAILGWILSVAHYDVSLAIQPESVKTAIIGMFIYVPAIIAVIQMIILWFYKLDREFPEIIKDMKKGNYDTSGGHYNGESK